MLLEPPLLCCSIPLLGKHNQSSLVEEEEVVGGKEREREDMEQREEGWKKVEWERERQ